MKILAAELILLQNFYLKWEAEINVYKENTAQPSLYPLPVLSGYSVYPRLTNYQNRVSGGGEVYES